MRKKIFTFFVLMGSILFFTQMAIAVYDGAQVKTSMERAGQLFTDLKVKVASKDYMPQQRDLWTLPNYSKISIP
jgi:hypothetical protein